MADEFEEEEDLTVEELRKRPCGKSPGARSLLHDDMTVIAGRYVDLIENELTAMNAVMMALENKKKKLENA